MPRDYDIAESGPTAHQRLPEYARDDDWIRAFLRTAQVAHIASVWDGQPFITPSTFLYDGPKHRLIFHSNVSGRARANLERGGRVCAEISQMGRTLPSNVALEFSLQFRSVVIFGLAAVLTDPEEQRAVMHRLIAKYFGHLQLGTDYRPATDKELRRTSVYEIKIESWSGKENWKERADQSDEWPPLREEFFR